MLMIAGETSGDLHAAAVAGELRALRPDLRLAGIGGARMERAGVELVERTDRLAVMGFVEIIRHIPHHLALLRSLRDRLRSGRVAAIMLVDYPGFNMKLAKAATDAGVPVLYYITPQVWAWGAGRLAAIARTVTKAAVILPFEEALLRRHGVDATFVGHPLLDRARSLVSRQEARHRLGLTADAPVLALFPGSRAQEIHRHLDDFVRVGLELRARRPDLQVIISAAPGVDLGGRSPFPVAREASFDVLRAADAAMCKSGTTTLEAAVAACPLVVAYRTSAWTYAIARRVVRIPHIGLVNVVAGREVAREFVQRALEPPVVADALEPFLDPASPERARIVGDLAEVRDRLGTPGAAGRVARIAAEMAR